MTETVFLHPAPARPKSRVWPVFLSFLGCPRRTADGSRRPACVYCAQDSLTGEDTRPPQDILARLDHDLAQALAQNTPPLEIGFYGGTFTSLPGDWPERFLTLAAHYRRAGLITRVRCSTRPDAITPGRLATLARLGLDIVELGAQTFDSTVLLLSGRNYAPDAIHAAAQTIRAAGLGLGLQLLPGLPGADGPRATPSFLADIDAAISLAPDFLRIYPCLVIADTPLASLLASGRYTPLDLPTTLELTAKGLTRLWAAGLDAIRIGLPPQPQMLSRLLAGPWHPALGALARGQALIQHLRTRATTPLLALDAPRRYASDLLGPNRRNLPALAALGLRPDTLRFHAGDEFRMHTS